MKRTERNREATERRLLETVGELVCESGFEQIGINALAARAGVSKVLVYRYFGSVDGLLAAYVRRHDFWFGLPDGVPDRACLPDFLKRLFREQVARLRGNAALRRLYRWELSSDHPLVAGLRAQRERIGVELTRRVCERAGLCEERVAVLAAFIASATTYLAMLGDFCPCYNGIPLDGEAGWERICRGADELVDALFRSDGGPAAGMEDGSDESGGIACCGDVRDDAACGEAGGLTACEAGDCDAAADGKVGGSGCAAPEVAR